MLLLRPCLYFLLLGELVVPALADELQLTVGVTEAGTDKVLRTAACALVRKDAKKAYARFAAPEHRSQDVVQQGDTLLVYRRGYDMARISLKRGQRSAKVVLQPASRECAIELAEANTEDVRFRLWWWIKSSGRWDRPEPIVDSFREEVRLPHRRRVPQGAAVFVIVETEGRLFWPRQSYLKGDSPRVVMREEQAWRPTLRLDSPMDSASDSARIEFLPDYSFAPPGPVERVDTWKWQANKAGWGRGGRAAEMRLRDGSRLAILPPVPMLALYCVGGRTVARRFGPDDDVVDLRLTDADRVLGAVPLVDRKPAPPGSFVISGRHGLATVGSILSSRATFPKLFLQLPDHDRGKLPPKAELVRADWLTVWHPRFGLAHLRWPKEGVVTGRWQPGAMSIRAPKGWLLDGTVAAYSIWRGSGAVSATPPVEPLRRTVRGQASIRYEGLQPGWYSFDMKFELVESGTERRHPVRANYKVEITAEKLRHAYDLYSPDRASPK